MSSYLALMVVLEWCGTDTPSRYKCIICLCQIYPCHSLHVYFGIYLVILLRKLTGWRECFSGVVVWSLSYITSRCFWKRFQETFHQQLSNYIKVSLYKKKLGMLLLLSMFIVLTVLIPSALSASSPCKISSEIGSPKYSCQIPLEHI